MLKSFNLNNFAGSLINRSFNSSSEIRLVDIFAGLEDMHILTASLSDVTTLIDSHKSSQNAIKSSRPNFLKQIFFQVKFMFQHLHRLFGSEVEIDLYRLNETIALDYGLHTTEFVGECAGKTFIDIGRCSGTCSSSYHQDDG